MRVCVSVCVCVRVSWSATFIITFIASLFGSFQEIAAQAGAVTPEVDLAHLRAICGTHVYTMLLARVAAITRNRSLRDNDDHGLDDRQKIYST